MARAASFVSFSCPHKKMKKEYDASRPDERFLAEASVETERVVDGPTLDPRTQFRFHAAEFIHQSLFDWTYQRLRNGLSRDLNDSGITTPLPSDIV